MDAFWQFAFRMARFRRPLALAVALALLSAAGLGVGLLAVLPIIRNILGERVGLPELAAEFNDGAPAALQIPPGLIDRLPEGPYQAVVWTLAFLGAVTVFSASVGFLHQFLSLQVVYRTIAQIRREAFQSVIRLPLAEVVSRGASDIISRIVNDTTELAGGLNSMLSKAVAQVAKGLAALVAAMIFNWKLTLVALFVAPALWLVIRAISKSVRRASRRALESQSGLYGAAGEALRGLRVVKVHAAERYEGGRFHRHNKEAMRQMIRARTYRALSSPINETVALFALGLIVLFSSKLILEGRLDAGNFVMTLASLGIAAASLKPLTNIINEIQTAGAAADRLQEVLQGPAEAGHGPGLPKLPRHRESIEFRAVRFRYPGAGEWALRDIDLRIAHGETVAIVGPNGSGKTTLLSLVPRLFEPQAGGVYIDGNDVRDFAVRSLRRQLAVVTQETVIFHATIRQNIAYAAGAAGDDAIREAARRARADEFIERLPRGYDTVVGEQGATLSGGQRQRLAIARAILRDPAILMLDEATSMIDADSEAKIAEALEEFMRGRTSLVVAHRLSTVLTADRIAVMDRARIIDVGRHDELLERCDVYRQIAQRQLVEVA